MCRIKNKKPPREMMCGGWSYKCDFELKEDLPRCEKRVFRRALGRKNKLYGSLMLLGKDVGDRNYLFLGGKKDGSGLDFIKICRARHAKPSVVEEKPLSIGNIRAKSDSADALIGAGISTEALTRAVIPSGALDAFSRSAGKSEGAGIEPVCYLASQVVAGVNHAFLCVIANGDTRSLAVVVIYADLRGGARITDIKEI